LSSQATVAGYASVILASDRVPKFLPMLTTAAGTIAPARVVILGAGVAGLQAIATARRLGAVVSAFDVRSAAAEQVQSLGAKFIDLSIERQDEQAAGGYAREVGQDDQAAMLEGLTPHIAGADIVISTAQIPGRPAPTLMTEQMVAGMKPGSVIVDVAAATGGNCTLTKKGETVDVGGVWIIGLTNLASRVPADASRMYARNVLALINLITASETLDMSDEVIAGCVVAHNGTITNDRVRGLLEEV
ncbi:MAG: NAD(P)(+) transhydrogenase (Re/Si-specific) subunit alpha, partial [Acidimicrobiia bacterium]|nr:NAD(P)(+) transhydrogenase (Re/Si-specific) subunit alpha [Acidimicrobiia bacterium]